MKINRLSLILFVFFLLSENHLLQAQTGVNVSVKVYLQGALIGNAEGLQPLMRDDLRTANLLPTNDPYTGMSGQGGTVDPSVFTATGPNAIVDWVFLELRNVDDPAEVMASRSALLQRDGDVVDADGFSHVKFEQVEAGEYFLAVHHRNHLGIMTAEPIELSETAAPIDFTNVAEAAFGDYAQVPMGEVMAMWAGDVNDDGASIFQGPHNDVFFLFSETMSHAENSDYALNFIFKGYSKADINMDGFVIYAGPGSDRGIFFTSVLGGSLLLTGGSQNNVLKENLP